MNRHTRLPWLQLAAGLMLALTSLACTWSLIDLGTPVPATPFPQPDGATATPTPLAETTFTVFIPTPLAPNESLAIGILDEVTGLGLNPVLYPLTALDGQRFSTTLPLGLNSVIKYRYYRLGAVAALEDTALGTQIRYRLYTVRGPGGVEDRIASWSDTGFNGPLGRISGTLVDATNGQPLPNILVNAGGQTTLTDSLGQYQLEALPLGTQNLTAYALDGAYQTFQQGAVILEGQTTVATLNLQPAPTVQVTFVVSLPAETVSGAPVRLAGNLTQLGNTFADLAGGISSVATRMPTLSPLSDGRHSLTLRLPVGADIRYKYTLGDGFWNAEHAADTSLVVRQLIVPASDVLVQDTVATWAGVNQSGPILFEVTVPANTPPGEIVSIQFNPFSWTEPIPMWPLGNRKWIYQLQPPSNSSFRYRYCRNDQCGSADDLQTSGPNADGRIVNTSLLGENIQESVEAWAWWPEAEPASLVGVQVKPRQGVFWAGVELSPNYAPNWQALLPSAMQNVQGLGANYVVIAPTWTATNIQPLIFAPTPGSDPLWADTVQAVQYGRAQNLNVTIFAQPRLLPSNNDFWLRAPRTPEWWNSWFDRYRAFALYHADLATQSGAQALVLGGEAVLPALPGGTLADGSSSGVPADAEARWRALLGEVRQRFTGQILWAHPYSGGALRPAPAFMDQFYAIYLLWSAPLATSPNATIENLSNEVLRRLDNEIAPFLLSVQKGVVIAVDYPAAQGAETGCVPASGSGCLDWSALARPYPDQPSATLNLKTQSNLYQAMLEAVNQREWVGGFISRGYYPPVPLMDKSSSVRGKPAADFLWYWFPRLTGVIK